MVRWKSKNQLENETSGETPNFQQNAKYAAGNLRIQLKELIDLSFQRFRRLDIMLASATVSTEQIPNTRKRNRIANVKSAIVIGGLKHPARMRFSD